MIVVLIFAGVIIFCFLFVAFRGAPYVPTHSAWVQRAIELAPKDGLLVDLGSGDGTIVRAAARSGRKSFGIELNPFLVLVSKWRIRQYKNLASVKFGDYWLQHLPGDTTTVFVFLAGPYMKKLDVYLAQEATRLQRDLIVISYGFQIKNVAVEQTDGPLIVQRIKSTLQDHTNPSTISSKYDKK